MQETISILKQFTDKPLYEACCNLLHYFKISFNEVTADPIPFEQFYLGARHTEMPKGLKDVIDKVASIYYIGQIDNDSLIGQGSAKSGEEVESLTCSGKYNGMMVFAVDIPSSQHVTRSEMAVLTRGFNRTVSAQPVILIIRQGNTIALSTCERMEYTQQWRDGEKLGKVSILRDINCLKPHPGHVYILEELGKDKYTTFDALYKHWMEVFSSELLTKKFYGELSDWYAWAIQVVRFPNDITSDSVDKPMNDMAVIRMITRLIFVWFLYCKRLIPKEFFDIDYIREHFINDFAPKGDMPLMYDVNQSRYYRAILQNLFFAMLNRPIIAEGKDIANNRRFMPKQIYHGMNPGYNVNNLMRYKNVFKEGGADEFLRLANSRVPFLNGGLFDCLDDKPHKKYYDGFSENKASLSRLHVPDNLFFGGTDDADLSTWYNDKIKRHVRVEGLIDIFHRYYFTVEENTPLDQEVSLDPELLGKAFENLLAAYVPETGTNARKQTGSFYTPREEVQYMVVESLVAHLKRMCGEENEKIYRALLSYSDEEVIVPEEQRQHIMLALYNCRILDPACGSGAFPMGMLQMMVHVLRRIDPDNKMWHDLMVDQAMTQAKQAFETDDDQERKERLDDIENAFNKSINDPDYARKLYLIEHCIYGVDIQPIAIQISKLRFFISLIVDQRPTADATNNFGIRPLPNLEANFVAANTLIPVNYDSSLVDTVPEVRKYKNELKELNHKVFLAGRNHKKAQLKEEIKETRARLATAIENTGFVLPGVASQLASWDMFDQNSSASFFDAEWMLGVKGGFDIVIANPPYVQIKKISIKDEYKAAGFSTFNNSGDLYCLFYEFATKNLISNSQDASLFGTAVFITSNKWLKSNYGESLRIFMIHNSNPKELIDLGPGVFDSAAVDTNILVWNNKKYEGSTKFASIESKFNSVDVPFEIVKLPESGMWNAEAFKFQSLRNKIERIQLRLSNFDVELDYGILTGANKTFILNEQRAKALIALDSKNKEIIKPIIRGQDIGRYYISFHNVYLLCVHNGVKKSGIPPINIERDYPTLIPYFESFGTSFKKRGEQGDSYYNLRNCAYIMKFEHPKIIYADIVQEKGKFYYDEDKYYTNDTAFLITGKNLKYLVAVLNSTAFNFFYKSFYCGSSLGKSGLRFKRDFLLRVPIPKANTEIRLKLEELAMKAFSIRKNNTEANIDQIDNNIDTVVYHLYGLTYDEVLIVDPQTTITREEYEKEGIDSSTLP